MVTVSGNPNPTNPTNPTTKYRCEFVNLNCIYTPYPLPVTYFTCDVYTPVFFYRSVDFGFYHWFYGDVNSARKGSTRSQQQQQHLLKDGWWTNKSTKLIRSVQNFISQLSVSVTYYVTLLSWQTRSAWIPQITGPEVLFQDLRRDEIRGWWWWWWWSPQITADHRRWPPQITR